jgi:hypothetical protein
MVKDDVITYVVLIIVCLAVWVGYLAGLADG